MNFLKKLTLLSIITGTSTQALSPLQRKLILGGGLTAIGVLAYFGIPRIKAWAKAKVEEKIVDETVKALKLVLTWDNSGLKPEALREKARLIQMRMRIMDALNNETKSQKLSVEHRKALSAMVTLAIPAFKFVDKYRSPIADEENFKTASIKDEFIESKIVESIILSYKPDAECTKKELQKKQEAIVRQEKITQHLLLWIEQKKENASLLLNIFLTLLTEFVSFFTKNYS